MKWATRQSIRLLLRYESAPRMTPIPNSPIMPLSDHGCRSAHTADVARMDHVGPTHEVTLDWITPRNSHSSANGAIARSETARAIRADFTGTILPLDSISRRVSRRRLFEFMLQVTVRTKGNRLPAKHSARFPRLRTSLNCHKGLLNVAGRCLMRAKRMAEAQMITLSGATQLRSTDRGTDADTTYPPTRAMSRPRKAVAETS